MKKFFETTSLLILSGLSIEASGDQWFCKDEASQRRENIIFSCGIGLGRTEDEARSRALDNADAEFRKVCDLSDDCRSHPTAVEPKRTECIQLDGKFKCYRLIAVSILEKPLRLLGSVSEEKTSDKKYYSQRPSPNRGFTFSFDMAGAEFVINGATYDLMGAGFSTHLDFSTFLGLELAGTYVGGTLEAKDSTQGSFDVSGGLWRAGLPIFLMYPSGASGTGFAFVPEYYSVNMTLPGSYDSSRGTTLGYKYVSDGIGASLALYSFDVAKVSALRFSAFQLRPTNKDKPATSIVLSYSFGF